MSEHKQKDSSGLVQKFFYRKYKTSRE